jgi:pectin methylesterase-like acyl-CoA thioesterase
MKKKLLFLFVTIFVNTMVVFGQMTSTITYDFRDGTIYAAGQSADGLLTLAGTYSQHGATYGLNMKLGAEINIAVAGSCTVRFLGSQHSSLYMEGTAVTAGDLGTILTDVTNDLSDTFEFAYTGGATTLKFKLVAPGSDLYLPALEVIPDDSYIQKTDVWDFGAEQLDEVLYQNHLTEAVINSWYSGVTPGTSSTNLPSVNTDFSNGDLGYVTNGTSDRLRTTVTTITRWDENVSNASGYKGRIYVNSGANIGRYLTLNLNEDDEVTLIAKSDAAGNLNFEYFTNPAAQLDQVATTITETAYKFVAKSAGVYHIFDNVSKPSYFRVYRKAATYVTLTGTIDVSNATGIPNGYTLDFTNEAGKVFSASTSGNTYSINLPAEYTYALSLTDANGYVITNGDSLNVTESTTTHDVTIIQVDLYKVTGNITGLTDLTNLELSYTPNPVANKIYMPIVTINKVASTYSVNLEANVEYTIAAQGVNDAEIIANTITIGTANETTDIVFSAKPTYAVAIQTADLDGTQLSKLSLTFTNLAEAGYAYTFTDVSTVTLRNGIYAVTYDGLDEYPIELALTSNLTVADAPTTKTLAFNSVTNWPFNDKVITSSTPNYKGLAFTGAISNQIDKGHLVGGSGGTIAIPVNPNEKIRVTYYYAANFSINGGSAIITSSGSTSNLEYVDYVYAGASAGTVTITCSATTYITNIAVYPVVAYTPTITVGTNKEYQTINEALNAIAQMVRTPEQRVIVMIDPGNYEEMLVINSANVTLKNAANSPSIALMNEGVDIDPNAVRITAYYGYGYNYYSQGTDTKWHEDILNVNKENGSASFQNVSGTTNGSYWNATVVVTANGFEAEAIIFENSFNQYISQKEANDVVVEWTTGGKGTRPTDIGNTAVQNRSFVERAAAIAIANNVDKVILNECRVVGRQDSFFGGTGTRVVVFKGAMMGAVDYIFGGMTAVFYQTQLVMNVSDVSSDASYLTAAQQSSGRGYLMYECTVTSAIPGVETASTYRAKPGYFGRPWQANTSEVVFYNTTIETSNYPGSNGLSLISPVGWTNSLGGTSSKMYEYGSIENSGVDNSGNRAAWATFLTTPTLTDGTAITTFNFTKGTDNWDPIAELTSSLGIKESYLESAVKIYADQDTIYISNVKSATEIKIYSINGGLVKFFKVESDTNFNFTKGIWIVTAKANDGLKAVKLITY